MKSSLIFSGIAIFICALCFSIQCQTKLKRNTSSHSFQNFNKEIKESNDNSIYSKVEVEANIDLKTWRAYLTKELTYILDTIGYKIPIGKYLVRVHFIVEKDGSISNAKALDDPGFDLAKFSEEVMHHSPKWNPGEMEQEPVRSYHIQPIIFIIEEEQTICDTTRKRDFIL